MFNMLWSGFILNYIFLSELDDLIYRENCYEEGVSGLLYPWEAEGWTGRCDHTWYCEHFWSELIFLYYYCLPLTCYNTQRKTGFPRTGRKNKTQVIRIVGGVLYICGTQSWNDFKQLNLRSLPGSAEDLTRLDICSEAIEVEGDFMLSSV